MQTSAIFFPFDLFGHAGTRHGAELLADAVREMLADNRREKKPTRARAYTANVCVQELALDTLADYQAWRQTARTAAREAFARRDFLLWTTGNHLGVLPVYDELAARGAAILQFDAHLDIYNLSDCTTELSHGNFLRHVAGRPAAVVNVGHRELLLRPEYVARYYRHAFAAGELALNQEPALTAVRELCATAEALFIDLDCDVFDPAYFPAVAHPLPLGLSPHDFLRFLDAAWSPRLCGLAISEFDPARDRNDQSLATLVWLIEHILLRLYERAGRRRTR